MDSSVSRVTITVDTISIEPNTTNKRPIILKINGTVVKEKCNLSIIEGGSSMISSNHKAGISVSGTFAKSLQRKRRNG